MCPHKMAGLLESYMVREPMPMANIHLVCSGDCHWLLVCSGVLVCSGISRNRKYIISSSSIYLMILSRSFSDHHLRCGGWLNFELSKRGKKILFSPGLSLCGIVFPLQWSHLRPLRSLRGMTKYRKERSFRERKIFIRKEHFITLLSALNSFQCHFIH